MSDKVEQENSGLTAEEKKAQIIERIIIAIIAIMRIANLAGTPITTLLTNTTSSPVFKLEEIGYFDLKLDTWYDEEDIITIEKDSYTQDMHLFISWIKNTATIKRVNQVKIQLSKALKKIALK